MGKNWYRKYEEDGRKAIWIVIGIVSLLIILIVMLNNPDRKVNFFSSLICRSIFGIGGPILGGFFFWTAIKDKISIFNRIFFIFLALDFVLVSSCMIYFISKDYRDIPYIIASKYESKVGTLTSFYVDSKPKGGTEFEIDGMSFYFEEKVRDLFVVGNRYRVEYLPHSKYVVNIYR